MRLPCCLKKCLGYKRGKDETKMKQLSIILPFYNREAYLAECLDSIFDSNCRDFELILIDDASTDTGGDICRRYTECYPCVKMISHSIQKGPGASRNEGIEHANGKYLYFMDSDDSIAAKELGNIIQILKDNQNLDLLLADYQQMLDGQMLTVKKPDGMAAEGIQTVRMVLENTYWNTQLPAPAWRYFVRRELVLENHITFPDLLYGEDSIFTMKLLRIAHHAYYYPKIFYNYRIDHAGSLTKKADSDRWKMQRYFKERFYILCDWMQQERESAFLKQWFGQWVSQCVRGFLFEREWERMVEEISDACRMIPEDYLSVLQGAGNVGEYLVKYRTRLFEKLGKSENIYLLPACQDNILLAEKWKKEQIRVSAFLDNHTGRDNHNVMSVLEQGYRVGNLKEKLGENSTSNDVYVICHWQKTIDILSKQLLEAGIHRDAIVEMNW